MTKGSSLRNLNQKTSYYYSIPESSSLETENCAAITLQDDEGKNFKVNGQHLKIFLKHDNLNKELEELELVEEAHNIEQEKGHRKQKQKKDKRPGLPHKGEAQAC